MTIEQWGGQAEMTLAQTQDIAVQRLGEWARNADAAYQIADRLSQSSFVPAQFRGKPVELTAAMLAGLEVGLSPMSAMRSFDIISGQAAPRAITLRAIVQSHGHEMVLLESTESRCRMKGRRKGSQEWQTVTWTMDRAKNLGLTGKDNWKKQPGAMLTARATSELARLIASDAILGIGYSSEEVADGGVYDEQVTADTTAPSAAPATRKMSRPQKVVDVEPGPEDDDEGNPRGEMFALFAERGIEDRDKQIAGINYIIGREIESRSELTEAEMRQVSAVLRAQGDEPSDDDAPVDQP